MSARGGVANGDAGWKFFRHSGGTRSGRLWLGAMVALALPLAAAPAALAAPTTWYVNGNTGSNNNSCTEPAQACKTISAMVNQAKSGDTIKVAAGTYPEAVTIGKELTLEGAQAGVDARTRSGSESIVKSFTVNASHVTIDGFKLNQTGSQVTVDAATLLSGVIVRNDIFSGYEGVALTTNDAGNILVKRNLFANPAAASEPIQFKPGALSGSCDGTEVLENDFNAATNNGGADVNFSCTGSNSSNVAFSGNATTGNTNESSFVAFSGVIGGIKVTHNTGTTSGSAIYFWGSVTGSALVEGNTITGSEGSAVSIHGAGEYGVPDTANTGTFTITSNTLTGNTHGIYVAKEALGTGASVVAHLNNLYGNTTAGVENKSSVATINATNNWWGCNAGPGHSGCAAVSGSVMYDPWLVLGLSASPSSISINKTSKLTADLTHNSNGEDTSGTGTISDGTSVAFGTDFGSLSATSAPTSGGKASVTLESSSEGTATASATLDNETVYTGVTFFKPVSLEYLNAVMSDNPLGYWRLGDALDTSAMSDYTEKYPGTYVNGAVGSPQLGISGDGNTAAEFVGNGQYGYVNDIEAPQHAYTMEAWVLPYSSGGDAAMIMQQGGSGALYINGEGKPAFVPDSNEVGLQVVDAKAVETPNGGGKSKGFHQVVGTWDGFTARLYVDGEEVGSAKSTKAPSGSATLYIGYGTLAPWFSGFIDEAAYYPSALSAARVLAHYAADPPPPLWIPHAVQQGSSAGTAGASSSATSAVNNSKPGSAHAHHSKSAHPRGHGSSKHKPAKHKPAKHKPGKKHGAHGKASHKHHHK